MNNNMLIKMLSIFIALTMLFAFFPGSFIVFAGNAGSGTCGDDLTWTLNNGVLIITGTGDMYDYDIININGSYVTTAPWVSLVFTSVIINRGVTSVGSCAFYLCGKLTSVKLIGNSVESIGDNAFSGCINLMSLTLPNSLMSIGNSAFQNCVSLTSIEIPNGVTSIKEDAFFGCISLRSITVADGNPIYHSGGNCLIETGSKTLVMGCKASVIPSDGSVSSIGEEAFFECGGLVSITIPDSVTSIGSYAFEKCYNLTDVTFGSGVASIGEDAFNGCTGLISITVTYGNSVYHSGGNCLIETGSKTLVMGCKTSVVPSDGSVTSIGEDAFRGCVDLTSMTIPESVTSIGNGAFNGCNYLVLNVYRGSYAHSYAISNSIRYVLVLPSRIEVSSLPDKLVYLEAKDELDLTGGAIIGYYDSGKSEVVAMTTDMVSGFNNRHVGTQTLTVTYEGQVATFNIEVIAKKLTNMLVTSLPNNTTYIEYKGTLDLIGGKYTLYYDNDTSESFSITTDMVSGFDITSIGVQTLTVTYGDYVDTFEVEVVPKSILRIVLTKLPDKTSYSEAKETLDVTGGEVTVYYNNDTSEIIDLVSEMVRGFNNRKPGNQVIAVMYRECKTTFNITIVARTLVKIVATHLPDKTVYHEGEEFDPTGLEVTAYYDNDTEEIVTDYGIFGYYSTPGEKAVTVTYGGKYYSFGVMVLANKMKGDMDGDGEITVADALRALRVAAKLVNPTNEDIVIGDTDGDGEITVADALKILRVAAKLVGSL